MALKNSPEDSLRHGATLAAVRSTNKYAASYIRIHYGGIPHHHLCAFVFLVDVEQSFSFAVYTCRYGLASFILVDCVPEVPF